LSDLIIYGLTPSSYVRTALLVCENKGVPYTLQPVDFRSDDYRAHHPFQRMPAMDHGEVKLYEAAAIAIYVDDAFDGPALQPVSAAGRGTMMQWISATNDYLYDSIVRCCVQEHFVKPMRGLEPDHAAIAKAVPVVAAHLDVLDNALDGQKFICGDALTLADLFLGPIIHYLAATPEGEALLPDRAHLSRWHGTMLRTPGFENVNAFG